MSNIIIHSDASEDMKDYYLGCLDSLDIQTDEEENIEFETKEDEVDEDVTRAFFERYSNTNIVVH